MKTLVAPTAPAPSQAGAAVFAIGPIPGGITFSGHVSAH